MLIIDDREPKQLREAIAAAIPDSVVARLPKADYVIYDKDGHSAGIERKEIADLLSSMSERKLPRQLGNLAEFDRRILLTQGCWHMASDGKTLVNGRKSGWLTSTAHMILLALQESVGFSRIHVTDQAELIATLKALHKQGQKACFLKDNSNSHG